MPSLCRSNARVARAVGVSGKDAGFIRAKKGGATGQSEITSVDPAYLDVLLERGYVPVISPVALGDHGESLLVNADEVAAELAVALRAERLIYVTNAVGMLESGELLSELGADALRQKLDAGVIDGGMRLKAESILRALRGGVRAHT